MGGVIIHDQMDVEIGRDIGFDLFKELAELGRPVAGIAFADHLAGRDIESGEQRSRAVACIVMGSLAIWPGRIGSNGWLRSSACICDFSSTHSTIAWAGDVT